MAVSGYVPNLLSQVTTNIQTAPNLFVYNDWSGAADFAANAPAGSTTGDLIATIQGANYFADGQKRGLALGSIVFVVTDAVSAGNPVVHPCYVSAVQAVSAGYGVTVTLCPGNT